MSALVLGTREKVPPECLAQSYKKDGCSVSMAGVPADHLVVDLDCRELRLRAEHKRCDFVFIGESKDNAWVVPIELKSGNFRPDSVAAQLQGRCRSGREVVAQRRRVHVRAGGRSRQGNSQGEAESAATCHRHVGGADAPTKARPLRF